MANNNLTKSKNKPPVAGCEKYEEAITHFVIGEKMDITKEELFSHLKSCKECRKDLTQWQDTMTVMKMDAFSKSPEGKAKMNSDFEKLKAKLAQVPSAGQSSDAGKRIDTAGKYGTTSGIIWQYLGKHGKSGVTKISEDLNIDIDTVKYATGWLLGQEKLCMSQQSGEDYVWLTPFEMQTYKNTVLYKEKERQGDSPHTTP